MGRSERRALAREERSCGHQWMEILGDYFEELRRDIEQPGVEILGIKGCVFCDALDFDVVLSGKLGRVSEGA